MFASYVLHARVLYRHGPGLRLAHVHDHRVRMCRGAFSVASAFTSKRAKTMAEYGADGSHGGAPSWSDHMLTPAGKAELCAFAERVQARFLTECCKPQTLPLQGELQP